MTRELTLIVEPDTRRELGRKPPDAEPPLDVVLTGSAGRRWPLRITRSEDGAVDVALRPDDPA